MNLASKFEGGFVTSASHVELAAQEGNAGTFVAYALTHPCQELQ
jgi:hypothetical protein